MKFIKKLSCPSVVLCALVGAPLQLFAIKQGWQQFSVKSVGRDFVRIYSMLEWHGDGASKSRVDLQYGTDSTFATFDSICLQEMSETRRADLTYMIYDLLPETTYYARLCMSNDLGQVSYEYSYGTASVISFTTSGYTAAPVVTTNSVYEVFIFTKDSKYVSKADESVEVLLVGGGGAGGRGSWSGGGGGGGGVVHLESVQLEKDREYLVNVGRGGEIRAGLASTENGGDTSFAGHVAYGGGGGGDWGATAAGKTGGSGGGGGYSGGVGGEAVATDPVQGYAGASASSKNGGGGGGATSPGVKPSTVDGETGGDGGDGYDCDISGVSHCYGSGGGSGACDSRRPNYGLGGKESGGDGYISAISGTRLAVVSRPGVDGLGGGGGGGGYPDAAGSKGGSGTVIIRRRWQVATPDPVIGSVATNEIADTFAKFDVAIADLGAGAASADVMLVYGRTAASLAATSQLVRVSGPCPCTLHVDLAPNTDYCAKVVVLNDRGCASESGIMSFRTCADSMIVDNDCGDLNYKLGDYRVIAFTNAARGRLADRAAVPARRLPRRERLARDALAVFRQGAEMAVAVAARPSRADWQPTQRPATAATAMIVTLQARCIAMVRAAAAVSTTIVIRKSRRPLAGRSLAAMARGIGIGTENPAWTASAAAAAQAAIAREHTAMAAAVAAALSSFAI
ncbi:MAG: hypothetical protein IJQ73_16140 [Kiritimatiellae bacterium]|nr:hypothetical protein [Kiritimatiellia bacterium]